MKVEIKVKRRPPRFKAGAELSGTVSLVAVDLDTELTEESETISLIFQVKSGHSTTTDENQ